MQKSEQEYQTKLKQIKTIPYQKEMLLAASNSMYDIGKIKTLELYGDPSFGKTHMMKVYLEYKNIPYTFRNVRHGPHKKIASQTGGIIPFVMINQNSDPIYIGSLIELMKYARANLRLNFFDDNSNSQ